MKIEFFILKANLLILCENINCKLHKHLNVLLYNYLPKIAVLTGSSYVKIEGQIKLKIIAMRFLGWL